MEIVSLYAHPISMRCGAQHSLVATYLGMTDGPLGLVFVCGLSVDPMFKVPGRTVAQTSGRYFGAALALTTRSTFGAMEPIG